MLIILRATEQLNGLSLRDVKAKIKMEPTLSLGTIKSKGSGEAEEKQDAECFWESWILNDAWVCF